MDAQLSIGELSALTGVPTTTLRYYDRIGLVPSERTAAGRRSYPPQTAEVLALIELCQLVGCSLEEIASLLGGGEDRRQVAQRKLVQAQAQAARLAQVLGVLDHLAHCRHPVGSAVCLREVRQSMTALQPPGLATATTAQHAS